VARVLRKTERIEVRVTTEQRAELEHLAAQAGLTLSDHVLRSALRPPDAAVADLEDRLGTVESELTDLVSWLEARPGRKRPQ
jgi:uncharacterized protein (DUF1778 family)